MNHSMDLINHMFDDHLLCKSSWCHRKRNEEGKCDSASASERDDKGYYRCKVANRQLYEKMVEKYSKYSLQFFTYCFYQYHTTKRGNESKHFKICTKTNQFLHHHLPRHPCLHCRWHPTYWKSLSMGLIYVRTGSIIPRPDRALPT